VYIVLFVSAILYFSSVWGFFYLFSKIFMYDFQYFFSYAPCRSESSGVEVWVGSLQLNSLRFG